MDMYIYGMTRDIFCSMGRLGTSSFERSFDAGRCQRPAPFFAPIVSYCVVCALILFSVIPAQLTIASLAAVFKFSAISQSFCCSHFKFVLLSIII